MGAQMPIAPIRRNGRSWRFLYYLLSLLALISTNVLKFRILRLPSVVLRQSSPSAKPQGNLTYLTVNLKKVNDFKKKELAPFGKSQDVHSWFVYDSFMWICLPKTSISKSCFKVLEWFARLADASQMGRSCSLWSWSRSYHSECLKRRKADYVRGELGASWNATVLLPVVNIQFYSLKLSRHFILILMFDIWYVYNGRTVGVKLEVNS